ncbi:MAG: hypothetical protein F2694_07695 [Actinobacteria bacterium]|nr:hypothetical protein [Actinomycetota bacterium]MSY79516.1 hypothetical protein [Actinomycetota bacterium]MTA63013.1 hypothetical protein [Actinomycetota bacterium]
MAEQMADPMTPLRTNRPPRNAMTALVLLLVLAVTGSTLGCSSSDTAGPEVAAPAGVESKGSEATSGTYQAGIDQPFSLNWGGNRLWVRWKSQGACANGIKVTTDGKSSDVPVNPEWSSVVLGNSVREITVDPSGCVLDVDHLSDTSRPFIGMQITDTSAAPAIAPKSISTTPTAVWLTDAETAPGAVESALSEAERHDSVPVFVLYLRPQRDCGGYSSNAEGSSSASKESAAYLAAVKDLAAQLGDTPAIVVAEPDATSQDCGDPELIASAVQALKVNPSTYVYLDGGHPGWKSVGDQAARLRAAGVANADGFALNVSNFVHLDEVQAYGDELSKVLDKEYVVDISRSGGTVPPDQWCNPSGARIGAEPSFDTPSINMVAELWVKQPGESDGECNGGPSAGTWWQQGAEQLASNQN